MLHLWVIGMTRHLAGLGPVMEAASFHILLFLCVLVWPLLNIHSPVGDQWYSALTISPGYRFKTGHPGPHCFLIGPIYFSCQLISDYIDPLYPHTHLLQHSLWIFWPLKMRLLSCLQADRLVHSDVAPHVRRVEMLTVPLPKPKSSQIKHCA
jgi:hypothetical protein